MSCRETSWESRRLSWRAMLVVLTVVLSVGGAGLESAAAQESAQETLARAHELALRGSYGAAADLYSRIDDDFYQDDALLGRSQMLASVGQYSQAIAELEGALDSYADKPLLSTQLAELKRRTGHAEAAREILAEVIQGHANPPVRSLVQFGSVLQFTGQREEAEEYFNAAMRRYNAGSVFESTEVAMVALANWKMDRFHEANALFSEATRIDPNNLEAQVLWGDLFQQKFNDADAVRSYNQALEINPRYAPALVGMARTGSPERYLQRALEVNPNQVQALETFGLMLMRNDREEEARRFLEEALSVNPQSLPALSAMAAAAAMREEMDSFAELEQRVLAFSPGNAQFYAEVADLFGHNYRFSEAVHYAGLAVANDPEYWHGHTVLGGNLIRLGEEEQGRGHLETAFANDPFNILTSNMLQVFDTLDSYATLESEHFRVNMSQRDALILWPYLEPLLEDSWAHLVEKYQFEPEVPVLIQIFENTEDFAVRSVGLPDIGPLVGICFGKVVTLISPDTLSANWQEIVWHELVHVFTLQMTNNRMPRWLSEGVSTWEEKQARPEWGRRQQLELTRAVQQGRVLPVSELNAGFRGANSNADLSFAYFQSYLVVDYIAEHYGFESLLSLIQEYAYIREESEMFQNVFGISIEEFDAGFREWLGQRVEDINVYVHIEDAPDEGEGHGHGIRENSSAVLAELYNNVSLRQHMLMRVQRQPRDFQAHLQLGIVLFKEESFSEAIDHLAIAHSILPDYTGYPSPPLVLSQIYEQLGQRSAMLEQLEVLLQNQQHDYSSALVLARDALDSGQLDRAQYYVDRALAVNPYRIEVHRAGAELAELRQDAQRAVQEYEIITALDFNDPVDARTNLAQAYLNNAQFEEARMSVLRALEVAPGYQRAQDVLLQLVESD